MIWIILYKHTLPVRHSMIQSVEVCESVKESHRSSHLSTSQSFSHDQSVGKANKPVNQLMGQLDSQDIRQSVSHSVIPALESDPTEDFYPRGIISSNTGNTLFIACLIDHQLI